MLSCSPNTNPNPDPNPDPDLTLTVYRVYEDDCVDAFGGGGHAYAKARLKDDPDSCLERLRKKAGEDAKMWFYECVAEGTEAAVFFSAKNARCTVIFRGTKVDSLLDVATDLKLFKMPLSRSRRR